MLLFAGAYLCSAFNVKQKPCVVCVCVCVCVCGLQIYSTVPNTKRKTYKFFLANDQIACARSSQGGLSLLAK